MLSSFEVTYSCRRLRELFVTSVIIYMYAQFIVYIVNVKIIIITIAKGTRTDFFF